MKKEKQDGDRLTRIANRFAGRRVLVVGDVILDRYVWGDVERTSPEAPVPIVRQRSETYTLGGAANVVSNLAALGAAPIVVGIVGADSEAERLKGLVKELGVSAAGLVVDRGRPTTVKTRVVSLGQQLLRIDREESYPIDAAVAKRLIARFEKGLAKAEIVLLSDYGKGVLAERICAKMIALAKRRGIQVVVDPKGVDYRKYRGASAVTPNRKEAERATGVAIDSGPSLAAAARALRKVVGASAAIAITRGGEGVSVFERGRPAVDIAAQARAVYDVTGAGDSFVAAMALSMVSGASVADAARLGNAAGSVVVGKIGVATAEPAELIQALQPGARGIKLRSAAQLATELTPPRAQGKQVVFANGCFDLIHLGHLKFLEQARGLGDLLVVAINSDRSVRAVKGPPRPVLNEEARASILAALDFVDYVVIFDEETPERLLRALRPDVLVKGKGLKLSEVVGRKIVEAAGGRVELLPMLGGVVTDAMVEKIARQVAAPRARREKK